MTTTIHFDDDLIREVDFIRSQLPHKSSRSEYTRQALKSFNEAMKREILRNQYKREAELIRESSLEVLAEMEQLED